MFSTLSVKKRRYLRLSVFAQILRVHQWAKNGLLFLPLIAAHQVHNITAWFVLIVAFFSFSLCASCVYIINDLMDLESDRLHARKYKRPFASGIAPVKLGIMLIPLLLAISFSLAYTVGKSFLLCLIIYFFITCLYSWKLKRFVILDCLTLAMLYTIRIIAGASATAISLSFWFLGFSIFLFLSLAFLKRYSELHALQQEGKEKTHGRGYYTTDAPVVALFGIASGYMSVLVMALYLNSSTVIHLYRSPHVLSIAVLVMLFWISWIWLQAHRGKIQDDPVIFAVKDKISLFSGFLMMLILLVAAKGAYLLTAVPASIKMAFFFSN